VTSRHFSLGERVAAGEPLYTLFDPRRVWIRFNLPATHASRTGEISAATFSAEGSDRLIRTDRVVTVASALDPDRRTLAVTMAAANPDGLLKPGMLVHGRVLFSEPEPALAVPAESITDENGLLVAYVQIGGETFERRAVTVGDTDGQWTTILSGVRPGEYVVTRGAYQIRLSSLNTSEISDHGHVH
jgi:multidrug efflux pump subunit AcrA (membrane-fusion protein)